MNSLDKAASLVWLALGVLLAVLSLRLDVGSFHEPGPGFLPLLTGIMLSLSSGGLLLKQCLKQGGGGSANLWAGLHWGRGVTVLLALVVYSLTLEFLGYIVGTFLLMVGLFSLYDHRRWWVALGGSIAVILVTYIVFCYWLQAQFPAGVLSWFGVR